MRPYNVEIFDRSLNFLYTTLLDADDFVYRFDLMDPVKNTIEVPKDFNPAEIRPDDPTAPRGWYIRIIRPGEEYQGYISGFEAGETNNKITFSQMITLLDINCLVRAWEVSGAPIEYYIKTMILAEFVNNVDSLHITGLSESTISTTTDTFGTFEYQDTDDDYVKIDLLDDLIYPAFVTYDIVTNVFFNPQAKTINVEIGKNENTAKTIEADLPNIIDADYTIRKSSKEVNRVDVYDLAKDPPSLNSFFLHSDGSWNATDNDRVYPVINSILAVDGYSLAKKVVDNKYNAQLAVMSLYSKYEGTLSASQISALNTAVAMLLPLYISTCGFPGTAIGTITNGTVVSYNADPKETIRPTGPIVVASYSYDIAAEKWNVTTRQVRLVFTPKVELNTEWDESQPVYVDRTNGYDYSNNHVRTTATVRMINYDVTNLHFDPDWGIFQYAIHPSADISVTVYFTYELAQKGFNEYRKTAAYEAEVQAAYSTATYMAMEEKAASLFERNKYSNLIELQMLRDDGMVKPMEWEMGRTANVIHDGVQYSTILSGREVDKGKALLRFGTIRLELTSYLKGRY